MRSGERHRKLGKRADRQRERAPAAVGEPKISRAGYPV